MNISYTLFNISKSKKNLYTFIFKKYLLHDKKQKVKISETIYSINFIKHKILENWSFIYILYFFLI